MKWLKRRFSPAEETRSVTEPTVPAKAVDRCGRHPGRVPPCNTCRMDCPRNKR